MIRGIAIIAAVLGALSATPARAGIDRAGTTAANFLQVGTGAGALGMGGATLGLAGGDLGSITWNAASLAHLRETQIAFSHVGLAQSSAQEWAAVAGRMQNLPFSWAFSGLYQGDGSFEGRDALGNSTGSFSASSMAFGANGAYTFMDLVNVGVGLKYVSEALGDVHGSGMAVDFGLHVQRGRYGFGAAMQNTGGKMNYGGAKYPFGAAMGIGASLTDPGTGLRVALDLNVPNAYYPDVRAGVEWLYHDRFALRTGYRYEMGAETGEPLGGPTFGMGAGANGFWLDYALLTGGVSGDGQHRVGLTYRPGALNLGGMGSGLGASTPATSAVPKRDVTPAKKKPEPTAKVEKVREPKAKKSAKKSKKSKTGDTPPSAIVVPPPTPAQAKATPAPVQAQTQPAKPQAPNADPIALDTAPPRPVEKPMSSTPGGTAAAAKRAQAANVPSTTTTATKSVETPKTMPFIVPPPIAPKPAPVVAKPVEKAPEVKPAEPEKQVEAPKVAVVTPPAETPKPVETQAAPVVETPKPVEKQPEPVKAAPVKAEPAKPAAPRPTHVTVKKGETLEDLAKEWGTSAAAIMMENNLVTSKPPKPGTKLKLPPKGR